MKSLIYTVFTVVVATIICQLMGLQLAKNLKILEMLGTGLIMGKFGFDYYANRRVNTSYRKYALFSAAAFIIYNAGLFSFNKIPLPPQQSFAISISLLLFSLLIFSLIGVNDSIKSIRGLKDKSKVGLGVFYLVLFSIHGLYAFAAASSFLKEFNWYFLVPAILVFDVVIMLPFIVIKRTYDQLLLTGLLVISLSVNTYIEAYLLNLPAHG